MSGIEREAKLSVGAAFAMPDLDGVAKGIVAAPLPDQQLDATYYDTRDLRLARAGISLRFRTGEGPSGRWTVKLPEGDDGPALVRREIDVDADDGAVPDDVAALVRVHVRSSLLAPVVTLSTRRRATDLRDAKGRSHVVVADDEVSVRKGSRVAQRFREVEVEVTGARAELLAPVVDRLVAAGAAPGDNLPKSARALGPAAAKPPEVVPPALRSSSTIGEVVTAAIANGVARLMRHDPGVRLGGDPEDVHQARVSTRRLRSDLRTYRSLLDADRLGHLRGELGWLGGELGRVRDADVLLERLRDHATTLPEADARGATGLLGRLERERTLARDDLLAALDGDRYLALVEELVRAARRPPLSKSVDADAPARGLLPGLVKAPWKHLDNAVRSLAAEPEDDALHEIRIRAKRARYAAEAAAPVVGKPASRFARAAAALQTVLGDLHDAVVAEQWLRETGGKAPSAQALVAGELICRQRDDQARDRAAWRDVWHDLDAKKLRGWIG